MHPIVNVPVVVNVATVACVKPHNPRHGVLSKIGLLPP